MTKLIHNQNFFLKTTLQKEILSSFSNNINNPLIIGGPKGLGKVNFTLNHFNELWFEDIKKNKSFYLFENSSHPDFFYLSNIDEKDKKNIPIENVRELKKFFFSTWSISKIKIAIINSIEDLSINSCNLLLKTLEELKPNSYIFIISNDPTNIIETIRSRCMLFHVNRLDENDLVEFINKTYPNLSEQEKKFIINTSFGSPGNATNIINNQIYKFYDLFLKDLISSVSFLNLSQNIMLDINSKDNKLIHQFLNIIINYLIIKSLFFLKEKKHFRFTLEKEKQFIISVLKNNNYLKLINIYSKVNKNLSEAEALNISKSDILIDSFKDLCGI